MVHHHHRFNLNHAEQSLFHLEKKMNKSLPLTHTHSLSQFVFNKIKRSTKWFPTVNRLIYTDNNTNSPRSITQSAHIVLHILCVWWRLRIIIMNITTYFFLYFFLLSFHLLLLLHLLDHAGFGSLLRSLVRSLSLPLYLLRENAYSHKIADFHQLSIISAQPPLCIYFCLFFFTDQQHKFWCSCVSVPFAHSLNQLINSINSYTTLFCFCFNSLHFHLFRSLLLSRFILNVTLAHSCWGWAETSSSSSSSMLVLYILKRKKKRKFLTCHSH